MSEQILRFEKEYQYDNGDAYRVWEFAADCPELRIDREGMGAPHIMKGDKLRQNEDEGRMFRARRRGRTIASFEWWQIKNCFPDGLPRWSGEEEEAADEEERPKGFLRYLEINWQGETFGAWRLTSDLECWPHGTLEANTFLFTWRGRKFYQRPGKDPAENLSLVQDVYRWHNNATSSKRLAALALVGGTEKHPCAELYLADEGVPGTPITAGVTVMFTSRNLDKFECRGRVAPLTLDDYERVRAHYDAGNNLLTNITPHGWSGPWRPGRDFFMNRNRWGKRRKVWTPEVFVITPIAKEEVVPICAVSDEAAIFELLSQVGGLMPAGAGA